MVIQVIFEDLQYSQDGKRTKKVNGDVRINMDKYTPLFPTQCGDNGH